METVPRSSCPITYKYKFNKFSAKQYINRWVENLILWKKFSSKANFCTKSCNKAEHFVLASLSPVCALYIFRCIQRLLYYSCILYNISPLFMCFYSLYQNKIFYRFSKQRKAGASREGFNTGIPNAIQLGEPFQRNRGQHGKYPNQRTQHKSRRSR